MEFKVANQDVAYIGISSRNAPQQVVDTLRKLGARFAELGFTLRTLYGGSADIAIYDGCKSKDGHAEIWMPWNSHQQDCSDDCHQPTTEAHLYCTKRTPGFDRLSTQSKAIVANFANLMHGRIMDNPAKFVICWSQDGCESEMERTIHTGEIGNVISLASLSDIPVFNFGKEGTMKRLAPLVETLKYKPTPDQVQSAIDSIRNDPFVAELEQIFGITTATIGPISPVQLKIAA